MTDSLPLYRIIYADQLTGQPGETCELSWASARRVWDICLRAGSLATTDRVERVR